MSTITESIAAPRTRPSATGNPRMRLKSAHQSCGFVQGAWWPRSNLLTAELPPLLAALALRFGAIDLVRYHQTDWTPAPEGIKHQGDDVVLDPSHESPHVISVFGEQFGSLNLLAVPPCTDATDAYRAVMTASSDNDASTPDQLLGIGTRNAKERHRARAALQR